MSIFETVFEEDAIDRETSSVNRWSHAIGRVAISLMLVACAEQTAEKRPASAPAPFAAQQCPKVDVQRLGDISAVDQENQQEIDKVKALEERLNALQQSLTGSIKNAKDVPEGQVTVASTGTKVRVRLSDELVFRPASANISHVGRQALTQVASVLKETVSKRIEIVGHTDDYPLTIKKYSDNWELSFERAHRVGQFLVAQGVDPQRVVMLGYAATEPLDTANSDEARAKNRRVEIFIEPTGSN